MEHPMRTGSMKWIWIVAAFAVPLGAQTSAGRIAGSVFDSSGAVIAGAHVTAHGLETGSDSPETTNASGAYVLYPLPPGTYTITAEAPGFRSERIEKIPVEVGAVLTLDLHLQIAPTTQETIVVNATSVPIVSDAPSLESTIVRGQVESLPLNSRDFNQLVLLAAGAVEKVGSSDFGSVALNGNRAYGNDYLLDGVTNTNPFQNTSGAAVSVDVIREFKVTSGAASAEYGQAGSQVMIVTRSGGNQFHGSGFEYHRDNTWQATNPFNPGAEQPFKRNQFGGSIGGPVVHNRTFFFGNYEGNRQTQSAPVVATTPPDTLWGGDFSSLLARNILLKDPLSASRAVFPGNIIPVSRVSPVALALRPYWGSPTSPGFSNNFVRNLNTVNNGDQFTTRLDQTLPRGQNLSLRFTQANSNTIVPSITANSSGYNTETKTDNASLGWTAAVTPTLVSEFRAGFSDIHIVQLFLSGGLPTGQQAGIQGYGSPTGLAMPLPQIIFAGSDAYTRLNYGPAGANSTLNQGNKLIDLAETVTHVRGNHTIKTGFDYRHQITPALLETGSSGTMTFTGGSGVNSSGYSFADFLLGLPANTLQASPAPSTTLRRQALATFAQDDWRVFSKLTLSIGLRHELSPSPTEAKNRLALFDPVTGAVVVASNNGVLPADQYSPVIVSKLSDGNGHFTFPILSDKQAGFAQGSLLQTQYTNFGPRFGFAYNTGGSRSFVVRGGYGVFYSTYPIQNLEQITGINPPFSGNFTYAQSIKNGVPAITLQSPFSGNAGASLSPGGLVPNFKAASNQQWNLTIEREIGWGTVLSVGYVGNKGTHLYRAYDANQGVIDPVTGQTVHRYQSTYGTAAISERTSDATSIYNAMQTIVRRRMGKGFVMEFNWTWAKGLDDVGSALNVSAVDVENLGRDRADSDYVRRHTIHLNAMWELPVGRGHAILPSAPKWIDAAVGGWRLSGIWTDYSGRPFTPTINMTGLLASRPDVVYGVAANLPAGQRSTARWFNPAAFAIPPTTCGPFQNSACFGNAGRNILIGPGLDVVDASLSKTFTLREQSRLTFRLEMFNALNHPNYDLPNATVSDVNLAGTITSLLKDMREAQFAVRLDF
jgi:hypothetical protein